MAVIFPTRSQYPRELAGGRRRSSRRFQVLNQISPSNAQESDSQTRHRAVSSATSERSLTRGGLRGDRNSWAPTRVSGAGDGTIGRSLRLCRTRELH